MTDNPNTLDEFKAYREKMNDKILGSGHLGIRRFFTLDTKAFQPGALDMKTKELLGLVSSMVLRCDDCITYHVIQSVIVGVSDEEMWEAFNIGLLVGGSIVIPHLRRAVERLEQCRQLEKNDPDSLRMQAESPYD
ncbi:MAG: carboxymuconolactone decarboxylase family protein [Candidatus Heimdallarchaeota archaeon]|nr:carboxymuconolactone decarboxylase family protein [Candidatus Heimdallarchaeota archaeon]